MFKKVKLTIILPCYNEESILDKNTRTIKDYLDARIEKYNWDILIVNDGSKDKTGEIADNLEKEISEVSVIHHPINMNLGHALQTGFNNAKGEIIVVLDVDLSYNVDHIDKMIESLNLNFADMVVASPYLKGGKVTAVPFFRHIMSKWVNRFMRMASQQKYYTFTGMARAYKREFIQSINLKTTDYEVSPEIMYKAMILRGKIVEIPAHLDWTEQNKVSETRTSSIKILRGVFSGMMSGFMFRPYVFFLFLGFFMLCLSMYQILWLLFDTIAGMAEVPKEIQVQHGAFSASLSKQFLKNPHSFIVGGITFLASLQFLGLGFISLQSKRYYEELFHLGSNIFKYSKRHI